MSEQLDQLGGLAQPAYGHHFGDDLTCQCGMNWHAHQAEPAECPAQAATIQTAQHQPKNQRIDRAKICSGSRRPVAIEDVIERRGQHPNRRQRWVYRVCVCPECGAEVRAQYYRLGRPRVHTHERAA